MENFIKNVTNNTQNAIGVEALFERAKKGKVLRIKLGVDPTRPDLTFGHMVVFNKLKQFQDMGHQAVLIIGDFTARIGDPSGRDATRPILTKEQVDENAKTYLDQAFKILDKNKTQIFYNSQWLSKMDISDVLALASKMTVSQMLERDDFNKRYNQNIPISIVEFMYPLMQGYDSVMVNADVEIGGTDQLFNMLVARPLQKDAKMDEQAVLTMPLLVGLDGKKKMSKTYGNYIAFNDTPKDMFGKIMSIDDELMWVYYQLLLEFSDEQIAALKKDHPMAAKKNLAFSLVSLLFSGETASYELEQFNKVFSSNKIPDNMPEFAWNDIANAQDEISLVEAFSITKLFQSKGEIRRLIEQGGVKINQEPISDTKFMLQKADKDIILQAGKRKFVKIVNK